MHGMILTDADCDYSDMTEIGRVDIAYEHGETSIKVSGFEYEKAASCRQSVAKSLTWARDVLNRQIEAEKLAPGGMILCGLV